MRRGLRPLSVNIGMATSYWPYSFPEECGPDAALPQDISNMLLGIRAYQLHPYEAKRQPLKDVWKAGKATLSVIPEQADEKDRPAVILVPSLINRSHILDLTPERSLMRWLVSRGVKTYLLDWGESLDDDGQKNMDGVILDRLVPAIEFVRSTEKNAVHALGYCMGGTLLVGAATHAGKKLNSIILLASPWNFHAGTQALLNRVKFWAPTAFPMLAEKGLLTVDWIQTLFASLDPVMAAKKFSKFADMDQDSEEAELFIAVEDWLNDGVNLPADVAGHCIKDWFLENRPAGNKWQVGDKIVRPAEIDCAALVIASEKDRLVEYETASALCDDMRDAQLVNPACGHIGMIAGKDSVEKVWHPIEGWIKERS